MKGLAYIDRGGVLFVGMAVGAVLFLSFQTGGKPLAPLLAPAHVAPPAPVAPAPAAQACTDTFPLSRQVLAGLRANRPLRIGVLGDSFGDGVWAATNRNFQGKADFRVYRFSKEGTGFTRYQSLDLLQDLKTRMAEQPIDIALIDFGANDTQGVWAEGKAAAYMSARWQEVIGKRAAAMVGYLRDQGVAVAWIGLPRMRKPDYDDDIQAMNAFYAGLMCKLHVPFVNPVAASEDKGHHFTKDLIDPETGASYVARADDGIHMSVHGYRQIARPVLARIEMLSAQDSGADDAPDTREK